MQLKVVICLRVHLYAEGLRRLLEDENDLLVVGMAHNDEEIANVLHCKPDVIITDLSYCGKVLDLQPKNGNRKVLLVNETSDISAERIKEMIDNGLGGILSRDSDSHMLQKAARKLHDGELWLDRQTTHDVLSVQEVKRDDIHLTKKEAVILRYICSGLSNKEISGKLFISEQTVKSHCNHLFKKFGVRSRLKLAIRAPQCYPDRQSSDTLRH
jgi:two-component system nitrate/nitrite response regulator NarP